MTAQELLNLSNEDKIKQVFRRWLKGKEATKRKAREFLTSRVFLCYQQPKKG